ncbi:MAG: UvrD-helicase domain-containing protein [Chitinophagales bacterium]
MTKSSNLVLYKASAGSGKTYTLAKEYLKIVLLHPNDYNKILAVTFTRKATAEMKSRIIEYLTLLEKMDPKLNDLRNVIVKEILEEKRVDISQYFDTNVSKALQLILHDYSNFNISTIDSFFQSIIRSFAKELDLPIGMEVELDTEKVIGVAVQNTLKDYRQDKDEFSKWLEEYLYDLIEEDKSWKIEHSIAKLAGQILGEEYQMMVMNNDQSFDIQSYKSALTELKQVITQYKRRLESLTKEVEQKIAHEHLDLNIFYQGNKSIQSFINKTHAYAPEANSYILKMLDGGEVYSKSKIKDEAVIHQLEHAWNSYLKPYILDVLQWKDDYSAKYISAELVLKNIYSLALLAYINSKIKEYKADQNLMLISDTNHIISLIAQHEEVPFIFEKSANFLKYILIDEFQDTSSLQWNGMLPLLLEILQQVNGLVLIVGDPKQSIYRWRGGKMELIVDGIAPDLTYHWDERKDIPLVENYRSAPEIVRFNNAFFTSIRNTIPLENSLFQGVLEDVVQTEKKKELSGYIQCKWLDKESAPDDEDSHLIEVRNIIDALKSTKRYGDIAVLTRNNADGFAVANFLQKNNIPVVSAESLLLQHQLGIKLLIAAMQYIAHPEEDFYAVKLNYLFALFTGKEHAEQYLEIQAAATCFFETEIPFLNRKDVGKLSTVSVLEILFLLMKELRLDGQADSYLWRFQDIVLQHSRQQSVSLTDFLEYWEEHRSKLSILPPDGIDAVQIYTIHKSKGLQFPVVILPYADWSMKPKASSSIWVKGEEPPFGQLKAFPVEMSKKMENSLFATFYKKEVEATYMDNINLLYVACTRPEEQLYILADAQDDKQKDELPSNMSKLLKKILSGMTLAGSSFTDNEFIAGTRSMLPPSSKMQKSIKAISPVSIHNFKEKLPLSASEEHNEAQVKGTILHAILSKIHQPSQWYKAVASTVSDKAEIELYSAATKRVIDFFERQEWFHVSWQHLSEQSVWFRQNELRPDKILVKDDRCVVIDYKTGAKEKQHAIQVKEYMEAYSAILKRPVSGFLLYIDSLELQAVN